MDSWYEVIRQRTGFHDRRFWELKAFTDNVVLGYPVPPRAEEQTLVHVLSDAAVLQRGLLLEGGFFVRGGIAFGDLYMDNDLVYGTSLLDAHETQEHVSIYPRIVLHQSAATLIPGHFRRYRLDESPQGRLLLIDEDGQLFINYLADAWCEDEEPNYEWLAKHREIVQENLDAYRTDARIFSKYVWVARYHNYLCTVIPGATDYHVDMRLTALRAKGIGENGLR